MISPVCVECNVRMRVSKVGAYIVEMYAVNKPYKIWAADINECPGCSKSVVVTPSFASQPYAQVHEGDFQDKLNKILKMNDVVIVYSYERLRDVPSA